MAHEKTKELYAAHAEYWQNHFKEHGSHRFALSFTNWLDTQPEAPVMSGDIDKAVDLYLHNHKDSSILRTDLYELLSPVNLLQVPTEELVYDEKLLIDLWHKRNPSHELNSNTEKDMFWETAFIVFKDYLKSSQPITEKLSEEKVLEILKSFERTKNPFSDHSYISNIDFDKVAVQICSLAIPKGENKQDTLVKCTCETIEEGESCSKNCRTDWGKFV